MSEKTKNQGPKLFTALFLAASLINLIIGMVTQMYNSTFALHMVNNLGRTRTIAGTVISIGALSATIYRFFGGSLTQKIGRRRLAVIGLATAAVFSFLLGRVSSMPVMYLFRVIQMFGYSMASTAMAVIIVDIIPRERIGEGMGYFGLTTSISGAIGPSLALAIFGASFRFDNVMLASACMLFAAAVIGMTTLGYEKKPEYAAAVSSKAAEGAAKEKGIWTFLEKSALPAAMVNFFITFIMAAVTMYLTSFAQDNGIGEKAGIFFTVSVIFMLLARILSGKVSDRFGVLPAMLPGAALLIICFVLLLFSAKNHILYFVAGAFYGFGSGMCTPALNAEAVRGVDKSRVSVASSTFLLPLDIAFVIGSTMWGIIIDHVGFNGMFFTAIGIIVAAAAAAVILFGGKKNRA